VVPFSRFGSDDFVAYKSYLAAVCCDVAFAKGRVLAGYDYGQLALKLDRGCGEVDGGSSCASECVGLEGLASGSARTVGCEYVDDRSGESGSKASGMGREVFTEGDPGIGSCTGVGGEIGGLYSDKSPPGLVPEPFAGRSGGLGVSGGEVVVERLKTESKRERNRRWRREKVDRKKCRKSAGFDWRKGSSDLDSFTPESGGVRLSGNVTEGFDVKQTGWFAARGAFAECSPGVRRQLAESRAKALQKKNELEVLKCQREIEVVGGLDVVDEQKKRRTAVVAATEGNMVRIEKVHAKLRATGNSTEDMDSRVQSVLSDGGRTVSSGDLGATPILSVGSSSISPDSSASMQDFRACQKKNLDQEKEIKDLKLAFEKLGIPLNVALNFDKETFTDNTEGNQLFEELDNGGGAIHFVKRGEVIKFKADVNLLSDA